jgi:hypothetical protein
LYCISEWKYSFALLININIIGSEIIFYSYQPSTFDKRKTAGQYLSASAHDVETRTSYTWLIFGGREMTRLRIFFHVADKWRER